MTNFETTDSWREKVKEVEKEFFDCDVHLADNFIHLKDTISFASKAKLSPSEVKSKFKNLIDLHENLIQEWKDIPISVSEVIDIPTNIKNLKLNLSHLQNLYSNLPQKKGGPNPKPITQKDIIRFLVTLFKAQEKAIERPKHDSLNEEYHGSEIYEFILKVSPLLEEIGVEIGKKSSIGQVLFTLLAPSKRT